MYIKIKKQKININKLDTFTKRIRSLRFVLAPITEAYLFESKKGINTYWFCQNTDIVLTDKDNNIIKTYENCPTEKIIFPKSKVNKVYILPLGSCAKLKNNTKLTIKED